MAAAAAAPPAQGLRLSPQVILEALGGLDDAALSTLVASVLQQRPDLAPGVASLAMPDLTFAPSKAMTERRCAGVIKSINRQLGYSAIACRELGAVFGCDVYLDNKQLGAFVEGQQVSFAVTLNRENKPQAFDLMDSQGPPAATAAVGMTAVAGAGGMAITGAPGAVASPGTTPTVGAAGTAGGQLGAGTGGSQIILGEFLGVVRECNVQQGFGTIACDALRGQIAGDVVVHLQDMLGFRPGAHVRFQALMQNGRVQGIDLKDAAGLAAPQPAAAAQFGGAQQPFAAQQSFVPGQPVMMQPVAAAHPFMGQTVMSQAFAGHPALAQPVMAQQAFVMQPVAPQPAMAAGAGVQEQKRQRVD